MRQAITTARQLGQVLDARRKQLKLSQTAFGLKLNLSQSRTSELLDSPERMTLEQLLGAAAALGLQLVLEDKQSSAATTSEW